jgi:Tfp pilus assembly protein PilF
MGFWEPMTWMSLQLDGAIYGTDVRGYHATNVLFHIANTLLLFSVLQRMTGALRPSLIAAGIFAVHPANVETVAWLGERKGLVCTFFFLLSLLAYARYVKQPGRGLYAAVTGIMTLSFLAKPAAVTFPLLLLLLDVWPLGRFAGPGAPRSIESQSIGQPGRARFLAEKLPWLGLSLVFVLVTLYAEHHVGALTWIHVSAPVRFTHAIVNYARYVAMFLAPVNLAAFYPHSGDQIHIVATLVAGTLLALWTRFLVGEAWRRPYALIGWAWFLIALLPVIGFVQIGRHEMADRYAYIPFIGLAVGLAWFCAEPRGRRLELLIVLLLIVAIGAAAFASRIQLGYWHDNEILWRHTLDVTTNNALAHDSYGVALASRGHPAEAIAHFQEAITIDASLETAHLNLGLMLARQEKLPEAIAEFKRALEINPKNAETHYDLGMALGQRGELNEAAEQFAQAVELNPQHPNAYSYLVQTLRRMGKDDQAIDAYVRARRAKRGTSVPKSR